MFDPNKPGLTRYADMWAKNADKNTPLYVTCSACGEFATHCTQVMIVGARGAYQLFACSPQCEERAKQRARAAAVYDAEQETEAEGVAASANVAPLGRELEGA